jgi:hypothetical protein
LSDPGIDPDLYIILLNAVSTLPNRLYFDHFEYEHEIGKKISRQICSYITYYMLLLAGTEKDKLGRSTRDHMGLALIFQLMGDRREINSAHQLLLKIKFYWNIATFFHLSNVSASALQRQRSCKLISYDIPNIKCLLYAA